MTSDRQLAFGLAVGGSLGLVAAAVLLVERVRLADNSAYVPSCSINPVLSCGSVMESWQASVFGFPNPIIGVAAFPVVVATGMGLLAGAKFAYWYWVGFQVGVTVGLVFVGWLVVQSLYDIGALCPYCMLVWAVVWPVAWYVTLRNLCHGVLGAKAAESRSAALLVEWHAVLALMPYAVVIAAVSVRFWSFWTG